MQIYDTLLGSSSLWIVFAATVVIVLLSIVAGYKIGHYVQERKKDGTVISAGSVVAASLALLAFMLAFTFSIAYNRFDARKQIVLDEVNTIGTTYLRADTLPEPPRSEARKLLRDYVNTRASLPNTDYWNKPEKVKELIDKSEAIQDQLWSQVVYMGRTYPDSEIVSLYITSLNEMIDLHTERIVVALQYRIPGPIWGALYLLTVLTFGLVGFEIGITGGGNVWASFIIAFIFSTVIILITDLDRPMQGHIAVSQQPMLQLQEKVLDGGP